MPPDPVTNTEKILQENAALARFRRALRRSDQEPLDDLLNLVQQHLPAIHHSGREPGLETLILVMLLEEHKQMTRLRQLIEDLRVCL